MAESVDLVDPALIDLTDLDQFVDGLPHEIFVRLRRDAPVFWHEPSIHTPTPKDSGCCLAVATDAATFSSDGREQRPTGGGTLIEDPAGASPPASCSTCTTTPATSASAR